MREHGGCVCSGFRSSLGGESHSQCRTGIYLFQKQYDQYLASVARNMSGLAVNVQTTSNAVVKTNQNKSLQKSHCVQGFLYGK